MRVKFLGTAAAEGWPGLFCQCDACRKARELGGKNIRTRSSCIIDDLYMIDFSADTYYHVLRDHLDLSRVKHLFITHSHEDHFYPQDLQMRKKPFAYFTSNDPLHVYGNDHVKERFDQAGGEEKSDGTLRFHKVNPFETFIAGDAEVTPLLADHAPGEQCYIYAIKLNGKTLLYGHDTGYFPEQTWEYIKKYSFDGVILDCTSGPQESMRYHMGFPTVLKVKQRLLDEKIARENTIFIVNHFSHNGGLMHDEMVEAFSPYGFVVTYDGMEIEI
ncbi:phosphoribosyl 1,2-cyclic phosphate phosphodiesterase [Caldanaerobius fijiensis DSM 17918]|uniref:Phosphoribosyl 1,2-cyclic phosphate phosphodiesterase n=1 Tax=Caldanaerobius fijiensis DSM 17918 TaxID=1121256 RepID=A0A1M4ZE85_9THEO|nr:MBL fold metallo-hydrolase [Caldanaerobius fijiensis]SHF16288.1 phosphoribosyl 1,2-cyclic phosphate phosphodiesterase [Caldanaerobius fijiensis DSM 17918]